MKLIRLLVIMAIMQIAHLSYAFSQSDGSNAVYLSEINSDTDYKRDVNANYVIKFYNRNKEEAYLFIKYSAFGAAIIAGIHLFIWIAKTSVKAKQFTESKYGKIKSRLMEKKYIEESEKIKEIEQRASALKVKEKVEGYKEIVRGPKDIVETVGSMFPAIPNDRKKRLEMEVEIAKKLNRLNGQFSISHVMKMIDEIYGKKLTGSERLNLLHEIREWVEMGDFCKPGKKVDDVQYYRMVYI